MDLHYTEIVPWGRSFDEYRDMFGLSQEELSLKIVGVGDGPASFNSQMYQRGTPIISIDPIYRYSVQELRARIKATYDDVIAQTRANQDKFVWTHIASVDELAKRRMQAMNQFCEDFECGKRQGRYVDAALPNLPFPDRQFDLALSSHFLFLYSGNRDLEFHLQSIRELLRVAEEVRIFPLVDFNSEPSPFLLPVLAALEADNVICSVEGVPYHFQKTGNEMLRLKHQSGGILHGT